MRADRLVAILLMLQARGQVTAAEVATELEVSERITSERPPPPLLDQVQDAVIAATCIELHYVARDGSETTRLVHPLGLAAKGPHWYLVAGTEAGQRTFRVDRMHSIVPTGERVIRPDGFDLADAWASITDEVDLLRAPLEVEAVADADAAGWCRHTFGRRVRIGPPGPDGRVPLVIRTRSGSDAARELAAFGGHLEVLGPAEVRAQLARLGAELVASHDGPVAPR